MTLQSFLRMRQIRQLQNHRLAASRHNPAGNAEQSRIRNLPTAPVAAIRIGGFKVIINLCKKNKRLKKRGYNKCCPPQQYGKNKSFLTKIKKAV
ncbi:hypothetical protein ACFPVS_00565 [Neisseria weixii]|uniref:hypothetical protein n=1 Tax=Neisseria weixii TaxID=1853276 RepID=UPI0036150C52